MIFICSQCHMTFPNPAELVEHAKQNHGYKGTVKLYEPAMPYKEAIAYLVTSRIMDGSSQETQGKDYHSVIQTCISALEDCINMGEK